MTQDKEKKRDSCKGCKYEHSRAYCEDCFMYKGYTKNKIQWRKSYRNTTWRGTRLPASYIITETAYNEYVLRIFRKQGRMPEIYSYFKTLEEAKRFAEGVS